MLEWKSNNTQQVQLQIQMKILFQIQTQYEF